MRIILPPAQWKKTIDGLEIDGSWVTRYELSLLPPNTLFPRPGQIWETVRDCDVGFEARLAYSGPKFSTLRLPNGVSVIEAGIGKRDVAFPFGTARLQKGERVRVLAREDIAGTAGPTPIAVNLQPLRYDELHESIVPTELRTLSAHSGYRLFVRTARARWCLQKEAAYLNEDFRLIDDVA